MRKKIFSKLAAAALLLSLAFPLTASAEWLNEELGPGEAVWVDENSPGGQATSQSPVYEHSENIIIRVDPNAGMGNEVSSTPDENTAVSPDTTGNAESVASESAESGSSESGESAVSENTPSEDATAQEDTAAQENALPANAVMSNGRILYLDRPMIALTYDDGPNPKVGNRIMDKMAQNNGRATFFMVGNRVASYASEVQRMVAEGHEVANHSYSHKYLNKYGAETIRAEVENCNTAIQNVCGVRPSVMRLPGGNKNSTVLANVNMPIILWNIDTRDWDHKNAQKTINEVMSKVKDGDIVLMHELYNATADASDYLIPTLTAQGYQLVTVSELAKYKGVTLQPNRVYYSF